MQPARLHCVIAASFRPSKPEGRCFTLPRCEPVSRRKPPVSKHVLALNVLALNGARTNCARYAVTPLDRLRSRPVLLGAACAIFFVGSLASITSAAVADANTKIAPGLHHPGAGRNEIPKGPLQIVISVEQQKLHLYSDGTHVADAPIATGVPEHPTPLGIFNIVQKQREHRSNIYSNAPMPFMERITWSGVALHEGVNLGHPASHGCIRMSHEFAVRLWAMTKLGTGVVIARPELRPEEISDPHLFVHKDQIKPIDAEPATSHAPTTPAAPTAAEFLKTAETVENNETTDASGPATLPANLSSEQADAAPDSVPLPLSKPADIAHAANNLPIAVFVSGKDKRIYVRQDFSPVFDAAVEVQDPEQKLANQKLGTHVFTAMGYADDGSSFRWNVISLPAEHADRPAEYGKTFDKFTRVKREAVRVVESSDEPVEETPRQALARIKIPQDVIARISELIVPGSSLIVSDEGLGEETGEGTNFIVVTP